MQYFPFNSKAKNERKNNKNNFSTVDKNTVQSILFISPRPRAELLKSMPQVLKEFSSLLFIHSQL